MVVKDPGTVMAEPSHWQPLALDVQIGQNGVPIPGKVQQFIGSNWTAVLPFALERPGAGLPYFDPDRRRRPSRIRRPTPSSRTPRSS